MSRLEVAARANVPPFHVMDLLAAARARQASHGDLVNFVAGQPSSGAPTAVREEAKRLLDADLLGYTVATGIPELRNAIAEHHRKSSGIDVGAEDIVVTTGSSGGFLLAFLAAFSPGDRVVMARPGYPCYRNVLTALGCEVVEIDCGPETRFQPTVDLVAAVPGPVAGLVIASPANPTGTMIPADELAALAAWCEDNGVRLISDEIYHGITYGDPTGLTAGGSATSSAWETSRTGVIFGSFSKYFSMTGWRLGWMVVPEDLRRPVDVLTGNFTICPPVLSQYSALAAFTPAAYEELDGHVARYAGNRAILLDGLPRLGIDKLAPADGAFYVYADVGHLTDDSYAWCQRLLSETGVAMAPGIDFDTRRGNEFVRLSFAGTADEIEVGLDRLKWMARVSISVTGLGIHPVKSTAIRPVTRAEVLAWGLAGDRRWMVVDESATLVSARELRELFRITADTPETEPGLSAPLRLRARGFDPVDVVEPETELIDLRMHSNDLQGRPAAESANEWIRAVTGRTDLRLVWCDDPTRRRFDRDWARPTDHAPYTDSCPVTLASLSSLRQLNDWIAQDALERGEEPPAPLPIGRFRPNVVVDGAEPFAEDTWQRIRIGEAWFRQPKRVDRCVMTTISATDLSSTKEPIRTLARYRLADQKTWFAIHLVPEETGTITVGDEVVIG